MSEHKFHITEEMRNRAKSIMLHAVGFVTGDPSINISNPYVHHPGVQVTVNEPGEAKWIYIMIPIDKGSLITDIKIAYHRVGIESRVSVIRLIEQKEPISANVVHDYKISENFLPSTGIISTSCNVLVNNSILLKVCMDFINSNDIIEFGSIEIRYIPDYAIITNNNTLNNKTEKNEFNGHDQEINKRSVLANLFQKKEKKHN